MTSQINILQILKTYKPKLSKFGISNLGLFGSYSKDEQSDNSDIDILIDFEPDKETFDNYMSVQDLLESVFKDEKVEVVTRNGLSQDIGLK